MRVEDLAKRKKSVNVVDFDMANFAIRLYQQPQWTFQISQQYLDCLWKVGLYNDKGKLRVNCPVREADKQAELERLRDFISSNNIPLAEFHAGGRSLAEPIVLTGGARTKEVTNILNRFDSAFFRIAERENRTGM